MNRTPKPRTPKGDNEPPTRRCNKCLRVLEIEKFYPRRIGQPQSLSDRMSICIECSKRGQTTAHRLARYRSLTVTQLASELADLNNQMGLIALVLVEKDTQDGKVVCPIHPDPSAEPLELPER